MRTAHLLPAATKVIFSEACVKNSAHRGEGVCLSACWDTHPPGADTPLWEQTPLGADTPREQAPPWSRHPRSRHPLEADTPPGSGLQHTVNERLVHILLECILVDHIPVYLPGGYLSGGVPA